jgi:hypothetical protein
MRLRGQTTCDVCRARKLDVCRLFSLPYLSKKNLSETLFLINRTRSAMERAPLALSACSVDWSVLGIRTRKLSYTIALVQKGRRRVHPDKESFLFARLQTMKSENVGAARRQPPAQTAMTMISLSQIIRRITTI